MKTWVTLVEERVQVLEVQREVQRVQKAQEARERFESRHTPMVDRLRKVLWAMPPDERMKPRPLAFFQVALAPKYHGRHAAAREVARGLQDLGWVRKRQWSKEPPFVALWYPPESIQVGGESRAKTRWRKAAQAS